MTSETVARVDEIFTAAKDKLKDTGNFDVYNAHINEHFLMIVLEKQDTLERKLDNLTALLNEALTVTDDSPAPATPEPPVVEGETVTG